MSGASKLQVRGGSTVTKNGDRLYRHIKDWVTIDELGIEVHSTTLAKKFAWSNREGRHGNWPTVASPRHQHLGVIMLGGIVVSNAILFVDYTNILRRRDGMELRKAVEVGLSQKFHRGALNIHSAPNVLIDTDANNTARSPYSRRRRDRCLRD